MKPPRCQWEITDQIARSGHADARRYLKAPGMPNDVKAYLSVAVAVVAFILAYWSRSPVRPEFGTFVLITAAFMIIAMWIFPEAGGKKAKKEKDMATGS
jgi:hypothetical protein